MATSSCVRVQLRRGAALLAAVSVRSQRDAALLLCRALGEDRAWLLAHGDAPLTDTQRARYEALLARRTRHEPMQYILGEQEFFGLLLRVSPAVLIPRPETEHLVEAVLARLPHERPVRIADVGTGSGAIAVALARHLPLAEVDALDTSPDALLVAQHNARALGLEGRIRFHYSDLLAAVEHEQFDCIISNPPYIAEGELLEPQVAEWEPRSALFAGPSGLEVYARLIPASERLLRPGGLLALEIGYGQQPAITVLLAHGGWSAPEFLPDLQGIARVAVVTRR